MSASAGNMVLSDKKGNIADSLNYGSLVDPWTAEGYQGTSVIGALMTESAPGAGLSS